MYLLKKEHRNLKILLAIGGTTYSQYIVAPIATKEGRALFTSSALALVEDFGFDGLEIDWEYPENSAQAQDFVELLRELRQALDVHGDLHNQYHFELTAAAPAGPAHYQTLNVTAMDQYFY